MNTTYPKTASVTTTAFNFLQPTARQPSNAQKLQANGVEEKEASAGSNPASNQQTQGPGLSALKRPTGHHTYTQLVPSAVQATKGLHSTQRCKYTMNEELQKTYPSEDWINAKNLKQILVEGAVPQ